MVNFNSNSNYFHLVVFCTSRWFRRSVFGLPSIHSPFAFRFWSKGTGRNYILWSSPSPPPPSLLLLLRLLLLFVRSCGITCPCRYRRLTTARVYTTYSNTWTTNINVPTAAAAAYRNFTLRVCRCPHWCDTICTRLFNWTLSLSLSLSVVSSNIIICTRTIDIFHSHSTRLPSIAITVAAAASVVVDGVCFSKIPFSLRFAVFSRFCPFWPFAYLAQLRMCRASHHATRFSSTFAHFARSAPFAF